MAELMTYREWVNDPANQDTITEVYTSFINRPMSTTTTMFEIKRSLRLEYEKYKEQADG